ncbi:oxygen-insensitive NADPH nitroreductase [Sutcliffiella cohnii]|uniref:oxygen-insensitive NADPH nitroreductase n=1 Tax=Sutcliffiella cohnii TaxID=33932 RepID=UPI002E232645|nr:oxygen-insensitive NADPH nitroreductase [Sutcliffiella cohnii]MED4015833.1 oxygen-insensitive NADPH nitroreductase [Sutcliffiella cohnii]
MNTTIETLLNHRSIRKFTDQLLTKEQIHTIVKCAQSASTSSFIQAYSIIGVSDVEKKAKLATFAGNQTYVEGNGHFFVFCADLHRHETISEMENENLTDSLESMETFMVSVIDATLAAQNAAVAAESLGLGICYIGGIRNKMKEVSELLNLPHHVIPLFGLAVGYPAQNPDVKPRLPLEHVYHENGYNSNKEEQLKQLDQYNEVISAYYEERTGGKRNDTWTSQMAGMLKTPKRRDMKAFVEKKGFAKK